ncbi:hypothetical protein Tco_1364512 [Tanacetum coccineum]
MSVGLTCLEHTDLSINSESTEVDAPPVNDDNANANEGNAEDDDVACNTPKNQDNAAEFVLNSVLKRSSKAKWGVLHKEPKWAQLVGKPLNLGSL